VSTPIPQNRAPFRLAEILAQTGGTLVREVATSVVGVGTDTRQDLRGAVFVALSGPHFDGHAFLGAAAEGGAAVLVVARGRGLEAPLGVTVIEVPDTLVALGELGRFHRQRWGGRLVAVAGSAGKTTTRSVIFRLLSALLPGHVHQTHGNLNNRIGVPMTLLGLQPRHRLAVVEVGTNMPGEVAELARLVSADVAVLTLIALEHTEGLGDLSGVAREEGSLFDALGPTAVAVGNVDDPLVRQKLAAHAGPRRSYGESPEADLVIRSRRLVAPERAAIELRMGARTWSFQTQLLGRSGALAAAAAAVVCEELLPGQLSAAHFEQALGTGAEPGRSSVLLLSQQRVVLDDTYNSNPASARQSIQTGQELAELTGGRLWLVLGEMRELGDLAEREHAALGVLAASSGAAGLYTIGPAAEPTASAARERGLSTWHEADASAVGEQLWQRLSARDVVVVKASRGVRAERVVQALTEADQRPGPGGTPS